MNCFSSTSDSSWLTGVAPSEDVTIVSCAGCTSAALAVWLYRVRHLRAAVGIGLIIGGAMGNLIDRLRFGAVADFLDFYAWGYHWPAFNLADSAITVGAAVLILDSLFEKEKKS